MTERGMIPADLSAPSHAADVVELPLLFPVCQVLALEVVAERLNLSVAALVRWAVNDLLQSPAAAGFLGTVDDHVVPPPRECSVIRLADGIGAAQRMNGLPSRPLGVLVIDDNAAVRALLEVSLGAAGFAVWLAADGYEGVTVYQEHRHDIDAVLLDVRMPRCDGPEALAGILALDPSVPCCFMSGNPGHYTEEDLLALGAAAVFQKPFHVGELLGYLGRLVVPGEPRGEEPEGHWENGGEG